MRLPAVVLSSLLIFAGPVAAQGTGWGDLDSALVVLSPTGSMDASYFMPDSANPATATRALGVVYAYIPGSAGSTSIHVGLFARAGAGWQLVRPVQGLFGQGPKDPAFSGDRVEITTLTLHPGEARCCPTKQTRWSVDWATGQAVALN